MSGAHPYMIEKPPNPLPDSVPRTSAKPGFLKISKGAENLQPFDIQKLHIPVSNQKQSKSTHLETTAKIF